MRRDEFISVGQVTVATSSHGGHPADYFAERIMEKLMTVADDAPEPIKAQAYAFRDTMHAIILHGIRRAVESDRAYRRD